MTQIQHVSNKEMTRRTGVKNALGYTFPEKDLILLRKGIRGKLKKKVLDHEINHLKKGEEGPYLQYAIPAAASIAGGILGGKGGEAQATAMRDIAALQAKRLQPWTEFGQEELGELRNWLAGPTGAFAEISPQDIMTSPEYQTALRTMESGAAARGGLMSGNVLRRIGEELAPAGIARERQRRLQELQARLGLSGVGQTAAAGQAQIGMQAAPAIAAGARAPYEAWRGVAGDIAGLAGQYQQQRQWQDFLEKAYPTNALTATEG